MEIISLNKTDLLAYVNSPSFSKERNLPISFHRAVSHAKNPRANANDIVLFLAKEKAELIGYFGVLPDLFFAPKQPIVKVGWVSCIWVKDSHRGKGVTADLFREAHFKWNGNLLLTDYVPATKKMYDATGFFIQRPLVKKGVRLYLKSDLQNILPAKTNLVKQESGLLKAIDKAGNSILSSYQSNFKYPIDHLNLEEVNEVDDEIENFILHQNGKDYFQRKKRELNWILAEPWVLENDEKKELHKRYYFSSSDHVFKNYLYKLKDDQGKLKAFFFFTNRNEVIKLPYFYAKGLVKDEITVILHFLQKWNAKVFTSFHPKLVSGLMEQKTMAFHKKEIDRNFLIDKQLSKMMTHPNLFIQDGDGDAVFT